MSHALYVLCFWIVRLVPNGSWIVRIYTSTKGLTACWCGPAVRVHFGRGRGWGRTRARSTLDNRTAASSRISLRQPLHPRVVREKFIRQSLLLFAWVASSGSGFYSTNTRTTFAHRQQPGFTRHFLFFLPRFCENGGGSGWYDICVDVCWGIALTASLWPHKMLLLRLFFNLFWCCVLFWASKLISYPRTVGTFCSVWNIYLSLLTDREKYLKNTILSFLTCKMNKYMLFHKQCRYNRFHINFWKKYIDLYIYIYNECLAYMHS